ncbi:hypothetical protein HNY73_014988 [Argiope bruennichi]|uniref:Uncharacterized protein n=1 Tax=Argiope bruennichi TaxID=94029 RepID=A0A8T0ES30_ARGBR|nr:hypothetical protein HNY73_014988 [Argiope bruennichi]
MNFKDLFVSTVHSQLSLSNSQKFQYLKGLLSDEPASLIKHIPLSNDSYEEAWGKLMDRYDKKKKIINALIKTFLEQKGISQANSTNLRNIVDTSDEVLRGLKSLGEEASSRDPWLIAFVIAKIRSETRRLGPCSSCLSWFVSPPRNWKPFVANRTSEILDLIPQIGWRYCAVKGKIQQYEDPEVCLLRICQDCRLWWGGPYFPNIIRGDWPSNSIQNQ